MIPKHLSKKMALESIPYAIPAKEEVFSVDQTCVSEALLDRQPQVAIVVATQPQFSAEEIAALRKQHGTEIAVGLMMLEFGPTRMAGSVVVPQKLKIVCVMHGATIDLTHATFVHPRTEIEVVALFGGATVKLPQGVNVTTRKAAIFGGINMKPRAPVDDGRPSVRITGLTMFGGVNVLDA